MSNQPDLQWPFYAGLGLNPDTGSPWSYNPVSLGGYPLMIDVKKYKRGFLDAYRVAQDTSNQPGEQTLTVEGVWTRFGSDWRFGGGQPRFDRTASLRERFNDALGVDVWTEGQFTLLQKPVAVETGANTYVRMLVGRLGQLVVVRSNGATIFTGPWATPTALNVTGLPVVAITDATCDDSTVFFATADGIYAAPMATGVAVRYDGDPAGGLAWDSILFANGRLVGGVGNDFREVGAAGAQTTSIQVHPSPAFRWTVLFGHPSFIYAGGTIGSVSELFRFGVNTSTGALLKGAPSLFLPGGEVVRAGLHYVGGVFLATSRGVRFAAVNSGDLITGRVIDQAGDSFCLAADGDYVWFGLAQATAGAEGLGRLAPSRFGDAEGQVPAWARDVYVSGSGRVSCCAVYQGRAVFAVDGQGVYIRGDEYLESGTLDTGWMDFGIPYTMQPLSAQVRHEPLVGAITVAWRQPGITFATLGVANVNASRISQSFVFPSVRAEAIELRFTLARKSAAEAPILTQWQMEASPQPKRVQQIYLPVLVFETLEFDEWRGPRYPTDNLGLWRFLAGACEAGAVLNYQEGPSVYKVRIKDVQVEQAERWSDEDRFFDATVPVILQVVT